MSMAFRFFSRCSLVGLLLLGACPSAWPTANVTIDRRLSFGLPSRWRDGDHSIRWRFEGATGLYFSHSGISAELIKPGENKFRVKAKAEVPSGVYEVRYIGAFGVSNPRPFSVGPLDELSSPGNNTSMAAAFAVGALSVVNGVAIARQSVWFRLPRKRISVYCCDFRLRRLTQDWIRSCI